ncbi:hypothetical protein [Elioraea sp.]|uniref:hypothetical protein n=1 Tax=Elioraea sp. TaxID=2185103 RepID=UPI003F701BC5
MSGTGHRHGSPVASSETLAAHGGLRIDPTPFPAPANAVLMARRGATDGDPAERWLWHRIVESLRGPKA